MVSNSEQVKSYRDLKVWQQSFDLAKFIYLTSGSFPKNEQFGLTLQMRRCAVSIPSNIAEGQARGSTREFLYFLSVASGSLAELETQFLLAGDLGYIEKDTIDSTLKTINMLERMLHSLKASLKQKVAS